MSEKSIIPLKVIDTGISVACRDRMLNVRGLIECSGFLKISKEKCKCKENCNDSMCLERCDFN